MFYSNLLLVRNGPRERRTAQERPGVVWHTQGSGKSQTMVFVARMIRASADLSDFKIVMVDDRIDLEEQLTDTFWNEIDKVMPTYLERKEWLKRNGAGLDV